MSISMRDLQRISAQAIEALPGMTAIKSGDRTVAFLTPARRMDPDRLAALLADIDALAAGRPAGEDEAFLAGEGIDATDWSDEAVKALKAETA